MTGTVVLVKNPFRPERDREVVTVDAPITVRGWLDGRGIREFDRPTLCLMNGRPLLRAEWRTTLITANDVVSFVALPLGGGGGGGFKNPLRILLMIAVMIAAPYIGGAIAGVLGVTSSFWISAITVGVGLIGTTLVNVLIPPPKPQAAALGSFGSTSAPSPTYSLQAQGNQARLGGPIPVIYGRHLNIPGPGGHALDRIRRQ